MSIFDPSVFKNIDFGAGLPQGGTTPPTAPGSFIQQLLGANGKGLADLGSAVSAYGQGSKANRVVQGNFTQDYDKLAQQTEANRNQVGQTSQSNYDNAMLLAEAARNKNESDAMSKLHQTSYVKGRTADYSPTSIQLGGKSVALPSFGFGPKASTPEEIQGANTLQGQMIDRLGPNGSYMPTKFNPTFDFTQHDLDSYAKPGAGETASSVAGAALSGLGGLNEILGSGGGGGSVGSLIGKLMGGGASQGGVGAGGASGAGSLMSGMMGKALPIAGAVTGGLGLIHDHGVAGNLMNGLSAGASIGSMVPGIGTAIGAGVGAAVGGLRSLGNIGKPSQEELAGRQTSATGIQGLDTHATPQQIQEAQNAGWDKPDDALALIMIRDSLTKSGVDPHTADLQAQNAVKQIVSSEKAGPQAVQQALGSAQRLMGNHV